MYLKSNLKYLFKINSYTQQQIGEIVGVENTTVSAWLSGRASPRVEVLLKLRDEFHISLDDLFYKDLRDGGTYEPIEPEPEQVKEHNTPYTTETKDTGGGQSICTNKTHQIFMHSSAPISKP